jgi:branched-chain amino acid aminotransferase
MAAVLINGQPIAPAQLALAQDRGLLLGESVFETVLVKNGIPQFWEAHIKRLRAACDFYGLNLPADNLPARDLGMALKQWARALLAENTADDHQVLRLTISGGAGGRGLVPQQAADALCLVSLSPAPSPLACVKLYVSDYGLLAGQPDAAFKTGNYLPNIQARKQAIAHGADEALMLNQWGRIASAAAGNVIVGTGDGQWLTPALAEGALPGIMLAQLRQLPDSPIKQGQVTPAMLETARHIFICNSVMEIVAAHFEAADASPIEAATQKARQWRAQLPVETVF